MTTESTTKGNLNAVFREDLQNYSPRTGKMGAPLAAILFAELERADPRPPSFDYPRFLAGLFQEGVLAPGKIQERYRAILAPVSGSLGVSLVTHPRGALLHQVAPGGAAAAAGMASGDLWVGIDGVSLAGMGLEEILDRLAGPPGKTLRLRFLRDGKEQELAVSLAASGG